MRTLYIRHRGVNLGGVAVTIDRVPRDEDFYSYVIFREDDRQRVACMRLQKSLKENKVTKGEKLRCLSDDPTICKRVFKVISLKLKTGMALVANGYTGMLKDVLSDNFGYRAKMEKLIAKANCYECKELLEEGARLEVVKKNHKFCHGWTHCGEDCCGPCTFCGK